MNYTTIEQSKKLLELGLSPESADMHYSSLRHEDDTIVWIEHLGVPSKYDIPCWSVSALLEIMPQIDDLGYKLKRTANHYYVISYFNLKEYVEYSLIDSCYKMVVWLIENGYIKTK